MENSISFSDCVRHLYIPKLNQVEKTFSYGIREWLNRNDHYIVAETGVNYIKIVYYDELELLSTLSYDISRLSCAFLESIINVQESKVNDKFLAWALIQYYYSAFYSAHSILKILGFGLVQLDNIIINKLHSKANIGGIAWQLQVKQGVYCVYFNVQNQEIVLYNIKNHTSKVITKKSHPKGRLFGYTGGAGGSLGYRVRSKLSNGPFLPERWSRTYSTFSSTSLSISFFA